ncbi:MAG: DUF2939 domain-containing protein [Vampirovibrionales bacterium]|nr:DUF2939 domain-containing protein [Vampirovibrionales bacterium]
MKVKAIFKPLNLFLIGFILIGLYFGHAYTSVYFLFQDIYQQKLSADDERINFEKIRKSLKSKMTNCIMESYNNDPDIKDNPFALMFMPLMQNMLNSLVDSYVSPEGLQFAIREHSNQLSSQNTKESTTQKHPDFVVMAKRLSFTSLNQMKAKLDGIELVFQWIDFQWKLENLHVNDSCQKIMGKSSER